MRRGERALLFETPAGFDDPLEMLLGCHRRIERQLKTLRQLKSHIDAHGVDAEASTAAQSVLNYFLKAADNHHHDEEDDLFPMLAQRIDEPGERARFQALRERLQADHRALEAAWNRIRRPLEGLADGLVRALPEADVSQFVETYVQHILVEEPALKALFERWLGEADRQVLGRSMAARRTPPVARG